MGLKKLKPLETELTEELANVLLGEKIPLDVVNAQTGEILIPANRKITKTLLQKVAIHRDNIDIDPSPIRNKVREIIARVEAKHRVIVGYDPLYRSAIEETLKDHGIKFEAPGNTQITAYCGEQEFRRAMLGRVSNEGWVIESK